MELRERGLISLDKELTVYSEGAREPFQGFKQGSVWPGLCFMKFLGWPWIKKAKEAKRPVRKS